MFISDVVWEFYNLQLLPNPCYVNSGLCTRILRTYAVTIKPHFAESGPVPRLQPSLVIIY